MERKNKKKADRRKNITVVIWHHKDGDKIGQMEYRAVQRYLPGYHVDFEYRTPPMNRWRPYKTKTGVSLGVPDMFVVKAAELMRAENAKRS